jgi:N-acetylglucosaminyldiphosphoundecaprenol N-acetyl-beta-D-mannosaminyltransferase
VIIAKSCREGTGPAAGRLLGVRVGAGSLGSLVAAARECTLGRKESFVFACANPHSLVVAQSDEAFRRALEGASAVVADGVGCVWMAALLGVSVGPRITGTDFFLATMAMLNERGGRVFFFGSSGRVLQMLRERISTDFPNVEVATRSPPFGAWSAEQNDHMVAEILAFAPDALWVGMTAPKQEKWVYDNAARLSVPIIGSIGAVFDYYAGATVRAPQWICDLGLEWLYRLPREPKRLWRRTFVSAPIFLWCALRERIARART